MGIYFPVIFFGTTYYPIGILYDWMYIFHEIAYYIA